MSERRTPFHAAAIDAAAATRAGRMVPREGLERIIAAYLDLGKPPPVERRQCSICGMRLNPDAKPGDPDMDCGGDCAWCMWEIEVGTGGDESDPAVISQPTGAYWRWGRRA